MNYLLLGLVHIYLIPAVLCQNIDYQNEDGTEVYDDYVFNPDADDNGGSGAILKNSNQVIDNDDEDYSDFSKTSDNDDNGSGNGPDPVGTIKPDLKNINNKVTSQYPEAGEEDDQPTFEIEEYNPSNPTVSDDVEEDEQLLKPVIPEQTDNNQESKSDNKNEIKESGLPLPAWLDGLDDFWGERWFLAALLGGAIVGFLIIVIVIIFICHAVRKKDEGSYIIEKSVEYKQGNESSKPPAHNSNSEYFA